MEKCRNVRIGEDVWARLKQRALDERVTLREVVERACHQYLGLDHQFESRVVVPAKAGHRILVHGNTATYVPDEKHWTPEE